MAKLPFTHYALLLAALLLGAPGALAEDAATDPAAALMTELRDFLEVSSARMPGMPGNLELEEKVAKRFAGSGFEHGEIKFKAPSFVPGKTTLTVGDQEFRLLPMHPTIARPGNFKEKSFSAPVVYLAKGTPEDLQRLAGRKLEGAIAVMEFQCGAAWRNFLRFGVRGFVFVGCKHYWYKDVTEKVYNTEVSVPRFFLDPEEGGRLRELVTGAEAPPEARIQAEPSRWQTERPVGSSVSPVLLRDLWVLIPGSNPDLEKEIFVFTAPMDANCVVPELAQGAQGGVNLFLLLRMLEQFKQERPARTVILAALNAHTQNFLGERLLAWHLLANTGKVEALRNYIADKMRHATVFLDWYKKIELRPETIDNDHAIFEDLRTLVDGASGKRVKVKEPLQDLARRRTNEVKTQLVDLQVSDFSEEDKQRRKEELTDRKDQCIRVLQLLDKKIPRRETVNLKGLLAYDQSEEGQQFPEERRTVPILRSYLQELVGKFGKSSELDLEDLNRDMANGAIREAVSGKTVKLVIELDLAWTGEGVGFVSHNRDINQDWQRAFGIRVSELAKRLAADGTGAAEGDAEGEGDTKEADEEDKDGLFVDTMTNYGGLPEAHYFPVQESSVPIFHAAELTPAFCLRNVHVGTANAFTPGDTLESLSPATVLRYMEYVPTLLWAMLADEEVTDSDILMPPKVQNRIWSVEVRTFKMDEFSPKSDPQLEVPGSVVLLYPNLGNLLVPTIVAGSIVNCHFTISDVRGIALVYGLPERPSGDRPMPTAAFHLDEDFVGVDHCIDMGQIQDQQLNSNIIQVREVPFKILPMLQCREFPIYDRVDPSLIAAGKITMTELWLLGGRHNTKPRKYGASGIKTKSKAVTPVTEGPVAVYHELKQIASSVETLKVVSSQWLLALNASEEDLEGIGFADPSELGADFPAQAARDMSHLNKARLKKLSGVADQLVEEFLAEGDEAVHDMAVAKAKRNHLGYLQSLYRAVGAESKAYKQLRAINADMLKAIVFYMALMLPFCFFMQKLLFKIVRIEGQIGAFAGLFVLTYMVFRQIHPAFKIALTPEAIFVAFVLGTIGAFVTLLMHRRFEGEMTLMFRSYVGTVGEIGHSTASQQAMVIGVNNMKRRRIRTTLTTATIVLVTFTMLAFSSVSKKMAPTIIPKSGDAPYTGVFYQWPGNKRMDEESRTVFEAMFAGRGQSIVRRWLLPQPGVDRPSFPMKIVSSNGATAKIMAGLGLSARENGFLSEIRILPGGRFFSSDDALEIILTTGVAEALEIGPEQVESGEASVTFRSRNLKVVGLIDEERFRYIKDLNGKALLPILPEEKREGQDAEAEMEVGEADDSGVAYVDPAEMVVLPLGVSKHMGGEPFSVSVKFPKGTPMWPVMKQVLRITNAKFYIGSSEDFAVGEEGKLETEKGVYYIGSNYKTSIGGLSRLVIPLIIAGTIVLNTMLGSVYERKNEIAVYNAVGLNPTHIAMFFLAESFVYGVIGSVAGYLIGQILAIGLRELDLVTEINVNFSSLIVIYVIAFTIGLVLLSTLYPAHVATRTAVPSGKRKWSLPPHDGQTMGVAFPFIYHPRLISGLMYYLVEYFNRFTEASIGEQIADHTGHSTGKDDQGRDTYQLSYSVALAPFDLGVTQAVKFEGAFDDKVDSYRVVMTINRVSGQDTNWVTTNKPFLERMRRLLLQWRNLDATQHGSYVERAKEFFEENA